MPRLGSRVRIPSPAPDFPKGIQSFESGPLGPFLLRGPYAWAVPSRIYSVRSNSAAPRPIGFGWRASSARIWRTTSLGAVSSWLPHVTHHLGRLAEKKSAPISDPIGKRRHPFRRPPRSGLSGPVWCCANQPARSRSAAPPFACHRHAAGLKSPERHSGVSFIASLNLI